jgi:hypothetical protein
MDAVFRGATLPTNFYVALVTDAAVPDEDTNTFTELTEIAAGNGYTTGGFQLDRNSTDFDSLTENDTDDRAELQVKDVVWTASSGPIPDSGDDARYAVLLDDDGTIADREVWAFWDLGGDVSVTDGNPLTLEDLELRGTLPAA